MPVEKSLVVFDVSPSDVLEEADWGKLESEVRAIGMEGLEWKATSRVPVAYGIVKMRIMAAVVDDLVSVDELTDLMQEVENVQSVDIYSFNRL